MPGAGVVVNPLGRVVVGPCSSVAMVLLCTSGARSRPWVPNFRLGFRGMQHVKCHSVGTVPSEDDLLVFYVNALVNEP